MSFPNTPLSQTLNLSHPLWQAPLPFNIIPSRFSAKIANAGGLGLLRVGETDTCTDLANLLESYQQEHNQPSFCFMHRLPHTIPFNGNDNEHIHRWSQQYNISYPLSNASLFSDLLATALATNPKAIGFANGVPEKSDIAVIKSQNIFTFAICHNLCEALVAIDFDIDGLVLQGIEAGGEQCRFENTLPEMRQSAFALLQQVRPLTDKPLILWSDFTHGADIVAAIIAGAQAVMLDRAFLQCALGEELGEKIRDTNEFDLLCDHHYSGGRNMRYLKAENANLLSLPHLNIEQREALINAYLQQHPEEIPYPMAASPNQLPCKLEDLLDTLTQQINALIS